MPATIQAVQYFYATVADRPGAAHAVLAQLAEAGVDLLAFSATPLGPDAAQLVLFPQDETLLRQLAREMGLELNGPHRALLVQGDDELGALAEIHRRLAVAKVNVYASQGVTDGRGGFGYLIHIRADQVERACEVLSL